MSISARVRRACRVSAVCLGAAALFATFAIPRAWSGDLNQRAPAPVLDEAPGHHGLETLILSGGCFWGVQGVFQHVRGVREAMAGYDGGAAATARYPIVSTGTTGHAESVRITYDPSVITYGRLLQIFFSVTTDPTQLNQQYPDVGTQYRSEIFATDPEQARIARAYIAQLDHTGLFHDRIVTVVGRNSGFYPAEAYHQNYLTLHPDSLYISTFDLPKVAALHKVFPAEYRARPVLVPEPRSTS